MPTYACTTTAGQLTAQQRLEIVNRITAIHHEETGAPRYLVQVVFYTVEPDAHYINGEAASQGQMWIRADIRAGRTSEQKAKILNRLLDEISTLTHVSSEKIWVYISDIPAENIAEYGSILPKPGEEEKWLASLPAELREKLSSSS